MAPRVLVKDMTNDGSHHTSKAKVMMPPSDVYSSFLVSPSPDVVYQSGIIFTTIKLPNCVTIPFVSGYQGTGRES